MSYIDKTIKELEEVRSGEDLSVKRIEKNERILNELCDEIIGAPIAGRYFSKEVAMHLAYSSFSNFSVVEMDNELSYISDYGDEIVFKDYNGMNSITYKTSDDMKKIMLCKSKSRAFVKKEEYSKAEDCIVSNELRVYNILEEPMFEKSKKVTISENEDRKIVVIEKYKYKNGILTRGIYSTTTKNHTSMNLRYENEVPLTRYEIVDGELIITKDNDSKVIDDNNTALIKLLKK